MKMLSYDEIDKFAKEQCEPMARDLFLALVRFLKENSEKKGRPNPQKRP